MDITKIYSALFDLVGCNEGVFHLLVNDPIGQHETNWGRYDILLDQGVVALGRNLIQLDTFTASLLFPLDWRRWPLFQLAEADFGPVDEDRLGSQPEEFADVCEYCRQHYLAPAAAAAR